VLIVGDAVEPREARVVQMTDDRREAELEFVAFWTGPEGHQMTCRDVIAGM
jgi:hypothetical protein